MNITEIKCPVKGLQLIRQEIKQSLDNYQSANFKIIMCMCMRKCICVCVCVSKLAKNWITYESD